MTALLSAVAGCAVLALFGESGVIAFVLAAPLFTFLLGYARIRRLDLPRSTVFRMLSTLEGLGFIERTGNGSGDVGVSRITGEVAQVMAQVPALHEGVPLLELQTLPQTPQLPTSLLVDTSQPLATLLSQSLNPASQPVKVQPCAPQTPPPWA